MKNYGIANSDFLQNLEQFKHISGVLAGPTP
jgi:hypothetical protein